MLTAPAGHRFMDSRKGFVSVLNLDSLRELETRLGRPVDPARFRANVLVEGWGPWAEYGLEPGLPVRLGGAGLRLLADIDRCMATHVDPLAGVRDIDMVPRLHAEYGHICCGVYAEVVQGGRIAVGDEAVLAS
ncbi:MAG: MOSC domain-containing protein [Caulobacteraceae bacterium]